MQKNNNVLVLFLTITICISASCSKDDIKIKDYSNLGPNKIFYGANRIMSEALPVDVWNSKYPTYTDCMEEWE